MTRVLRLLGTSLFLAAGAAAADPPPVDFAREIQPILAGRCISCHGPDQHKAGLRLDRRDLALTGGDSGACIEPGLSAESLLIDKVAAVEPSEAMPPKGKGDRLTPEEVGRLRAWIDQGAKWPEGLVIARATTKPGHWSFQQPTRPAIPTTMKAGWIKSPIDAFILANLESKRVAPSPEAERRTLIRRLSLDLLGLIPTSEEVTAFEHDTRPDAYEQLIDRLMASPHFGERWGRHWLDLARYADSDGYEKDTPRPFAYRYRDWVINAINTDLPFDQFTIEQLAGDLLPNATPARKIATGFHRNTLTNKEGGVDQEEFRVAAVVDRTNTTGTVWLGLTVGCAQCHTHKYDPITQREYYGLFAFFNSGEEIDLPVPPRAEDAAALVQARAKHTSSLNKARKTLKADEAKQRPERQKAWEAALTEAPEKAKDLPGDVKAILAVAAADRNADQARRLADYHRSIDAAAIKLKANVDAIVKKAPKDDSKAPTLAEKQGGRATHLLIRGDFLRPGDEIEPGTPAFLPPLRAVESSGGSDTDNPPTRLDLARWLVDPANPLTARVEVNRIWRCLFGRPLVATMGDFGIQGAKPGNAALLDWLATELPRLGWSRKALIRAIVTSATYRQSSDVRPELIDRDPNNEWLARQNRYRPEAEVVRDLFLAAGGLLARKIGGPSVKPPQPPGISELTYAGSAKWVESTGADRYRRGLYTWFQRTSPFPMLMTFDAPDSNVCLVKRERSNTPLQALTLLNDASFVECARGLARRVLESGPDCRDSIDERLDSACLIALGRRPDATERAVLKSLLASLVKACQSDPNAGNLAGDITRDGLTVPQVAAWVALCRAILNLDEFVTRE